VTIAVVVVAVVAVVVDKTNMKSINCLSVLMVMINVINHHQPCFISPLRAKNGGYCSKMINVINYESVVAFFKYKLNSHHRIID